MDKRIARYQVVDLPPGRRLMANANRLYWQKHFMYGLLEVDVTIVRQFIEEHRARTGEKLSFTGYLTFCLARAVDENKAVQAYFKGHKQLVICDDVDVGLMIEQKIGDRRALMGYTVRRANHKTYQEIHQEIRSVQSGPAPPSRGMPAWLQKAFLLPPPLSGWFGAVLDLAVRRDPTIFTSMAGTVGITAVGMFGKGQGGWGVAPLTHGLNLIVGGIAWKPAVVEGRVEPREILDLTVMYDHDVIDGAPAARFTQRLVELIEGGYGLDENLHQGGQP
jgi:pyruvate/2-oxoglutarate dehydrogenase complex dihydrolipoamide acyltransferase (E2) component